VGVPAGFVAASRAAVCFTSVEGVHRDAGFAGVGATPSIFGGEWTHAVSRAMTLASASAGRLTSSRLPWRAGAGGARVGLGHF
jgi:hypothetical protein